MNTYNLLLEFFNKQNQEGKQVEELIETRAFSIDASVSFLDQTLQEESLRSNVVLGTNPFSSTSIDTHYIDLSKIFSDLWPGDSYLSIGPGAGHYIEVIPSGDRTIIVPQNQGRTILTLNGAKPVPLKYHLGQKQGSYLPVVKITTEKSNSLQTLLQS